MSAHCFTYGSLMCDDIMAKVAGTPLAATPARLDGYRRSPVIGEAYPGMVSMVGEAVESGKPSFVHVQIAQYAGKESGNIGALNPKPVVGALVDSEVTMYDYATGARM